MSWDEKVTARYFIHYDLIHARLIFFPKPSHKRTTLLLPYMAVEQMMVVDLSEC